MQLDIFNQKKEEDYKAYWEKFYAPQLKRAKESRLKKSEPIYMISIHPERLGEKIYLNELLKTRNYVRFRDEKRKIS